MKILQGKLIESRFKIPTKPGLDGPLCCTSRKDFERDQVTYMSDSLGLHEISNPSSTEFAVSMHRIEKSSYDRLTSEAYSNEFDVRSKGGIFQSCA
ncbi:putative Cysteine dioxygenase [Glarea lozoyensis 74030]|uniref:Cysteine dioxygenase n=1 Tax=Glarea lozoyensis (strain ATCC 74030 / MF5533) TaxID=1104152 RepID=H0EMI9_GLAL7|nr:putative Cysteine dioxygenase [Glarea lozoyensis 74030]